MLLMIQVKHFLCDYILVNGFIVRKANARAWFLPLLVHSIIHGAFMGIIVLMFDPGLALPGFLLDTTSHFLIDRWKAKTTLKYWHAFGLDQLLHQIIYISIFYLTVIKI